MFNEIDQALALSNDWKKRGTIIYKDVSKMLKDKENLINHLVMEDKSIDEKHFVEVEEFQNILDQITIFSEEYKKKTLPINIIKKLCEYELYIYEKLVTEELQEKIDEELEKGEKIIEETEKIIEEINRLWENNVSEEEIRSFVYDKYKELFPQFNENMLNILSETAFLMTTVGKKVRINLSNEQIEKLGKIKGKSGVCGTCLEDITKNEEVITLPCDEKHIYHPDCILPWFKLNVNCPTCRKDLRELL